MAAASSPAPQSLSVSNFRIRRMKAEDVAGIMAIESVSFGRHHWSEDSFLNEMGNPLGRYYALTQQDAPYLAGYCGYWMVLDEIHITTIAVHPDLRGLALGEVQLLHILDRVMGQTVKWVTLEVRTSNTSAQNLYYKYGFHCAGQRPRYYQDTDEDALIMTTDDILSAPYRALVKENRQRLVERIGGLPEGFGQG